MWRAVALVVAHAPLSASAIETMRIAMSAESSVELTARGLSFGPDEEDATFHPVEKNRARLRQQNGRLTLNGAPLLGEAVRFRAVAEPERSAGGGSTGVPLVRGTEPERPAGGGSTGVPLVRGTEPERSAGGGSTGVPLVRGAEPIRVGGTPVRGDVVVQVHRDGLQLINVIPLEDYLVGVLGGEMPSTFPDEALKAQAVAARTYALHRKLEAYGQAYHLGSGVLSQVYGGLFAEDGRTRAAVVATRGQVLTYELAPIEAYFHASCGGRTESGLDALGRDLPYLQSVECPCGKLAASRWALTLPASEHAQLEVLSRSRTGRARRILVAPGRAVDAVSFRERVGYSRLKSLSFDVARGKRDYLLTGRGYGHGAGMCQWGAKAHADAGWDYRQILLRYYPGAELQALY